MNEWIPIGVLVVLIYLQLKIFKGILKMIGMVVILTGALLVANYLLLPKLGMAPVPIGLEKFFK